MALSGVQKYLSEFYATYGLVFCGTGAIVINDLTGGAITHVGVAMAFGLAVTVFIYAFGDISGAHMNPAVTLGFWLSGRFPGSRVAPYLVSQFTGACLASGTWLFFFPSHPDLGATLPSGAAAPSFLLEILLTFFLMLVIMHVSTGSKETGNMAAIAIGGTVMLEAFFAGPVSGASMNPARSLGPALVSGKTEHLWIYLTAPVLGAALAIVTCRGTKGKACCPFPGASCIPSPPDIK